MGQRGGTKSCHAILSLTWHHVLSRAALQWCACCQGMEEEEEEGQGSCHHSLLGEVGPGGPGTRPVQPSEPRSSNGGGTSSNPHLSICPSPSFAHGLDTTGSGPCRARHIPLPVQGRPCAQPLSHPVVSLSPGRARAEVEAWAKQARKIASRTHHHPPHPTQTGSQDSLSTTMGRAPQLGILGDLLLLLLLATVGISTHGGACLRPSPAARV